MSVHSSVESQQPQAQSIPVLVLTLDGRKLPAIQHSTIVITLDGIPEIVEGSIYYTDAQGDEILNIVDLALETDERPIYWFFSDTQNPIYWQSGNFFNSDGTPFTGSISGYKASALTKSTNSIRSIVWIRSGEIYYEAIEVTEGDLATYQIDNQAISISASWTIYHTLPSPKYKDTHTIVTSETPQAIPSDLPISGVTIAYSVPMRTLRNRTLSSVAIGGTDRTHGGNYSLNSEAPYGEVVPPILSAIGLAVIEVVYRQRLSPSIGKGVPPVERTI